MKGKRPGGENSCPVPAVTLVIIGGNENKGSEAPENKEKPADFIRLQVFETFKKLINKKDPVVAVVTTASSEGGEMFHKYVKAFEKVGITNVGAYPSRQQERSHGRRPK